jgi:tRNA dimethylallyltransferase
MTIADAVDETSALTRRFARRQVSWFTRNPDIQWFDAPADIEDVLRVISN